MSDFRTTPIAIWRYIARMAKFKGGVRKSDSRTEPLCIYQFRYSYVCGSGDLTNIRTTWKYKHCLKYQVVIYFHEVHYKNGVSSKKNDSIIIFFFFRAFPVLGDTAVFGTAVVLREAANF